MNTTHNRKKTIAATLGAAAAAVATPLMLFAGAGTAQAVEPHNNGAVFVTYDTGPGGLVANILDRKNGPGTEFCTYQSVGTGLQGPIPFNGGAVVTGNTNPGAVLIPGIPLRQSWRVTVSCPKGGSLSFATTY